MHEVSLVRLYAMRAAYLFMFLGLCIFQWPDILHHAKPWGLNEGIVHCVLGGLSIMAAIGVRYPLRMLPLMLFETVWKSMWLLIVALPAWRAGQIDDGIASTIVACGMGVIFPIVIPWPYVFKNYVQAPADRWK